MQTGCPAAKLTLATRRAPRASLTGITAANPTVAAQSLTIVSFAGLRRPGCPVRRYARTRPLYTVPCGAPPWLDGPSCGAPPPRLPRAAVHALPPPSRRPPAALPPPSDRTAPQNAGPSSTAFMNSSWVPSA
jgi:hypothetical protein